MISQLDTLRRPATGAIHPDDLGRLREELRISLEQSYAELERVEMLLVAVQVRHANAVAGNAT